MRGDIFERGLKLVQPRRLFLAARDHIRRHLEIAHERRQLIDKTHRLVKRARLHIGKTGKYLGKGGIFFERGARLDAVQPVFAYVRLGAAAAKRAHIFTAVKYGDGEVGKPETAPIIDALMRPSRLETGMRGKPQAALFQTFVFTHRLAKDNVVAGIDDDSAHVVEHAEIKPRRL